VGMADLETGFLCLVQLNCGIVYCNWIALEFNATQLQ